MCINFRFRICHCFVDSAYERPKDPPHFQHTVVQRSANVLLDGWELSGVTLVQSGTPFTVINSAGNTGISLTDNAGVSSGLGIAASYPDVVKGLPSPGNNARSFGPLIGNPAQFVAPRGLTFGDAGRNFLNNPGRTNFDIAVLKHFKIREASRLEFRAEAFNVFNHTQFRVYDPDNPGAAEIMLSVAMPARFIPPGSEAAELIASRALRSCTRLMPIDHAPFSLG